MLDNGSTWDPEDFQLDVIRDILDPSIDEVWNVIPEGNGKTTMMAGVELYHGDHTPDALVVVGASSRDQCKILHDQAAGFVRRTPYMNKRFKVLDGFRLIRCVRTGGQIQVFSADDRTGDGVIPTLALLDELHRHRDLRLYRTWRGKLAKRGGTLGAISTAGEPDSEFEQVRTKLRTEATDIKRDGPMEAHTRAAGGGMVLHDWAVPANCDCENMDHVKAANPLPTITPDTLRKKFESPTMTTPHWRRFVCNQAMRTAESGIQEIEWDIRRTDEEIPSGAPVYVGIDFGWKWDTTAMVPIWAPESTKRIIGKPEIVVPPMDGTATHPQDMRDAFDRLLELYAVEYVVLDPNAGGEEFAVWLEETYGIVVIEHSQATGPMSLAAERWLEALREGWLLHTGDPDLRRHVLNGVAKLLRDGRTRFDRSSQSRSPELQARRVIDALDAGCMANSVITANEAGSSEPMVLMA